MGYVVVPSPKILITFPWPIRTCIKVNHISLVISKMLLYCRHTHTHTEILLLERWYIPKLIAHLILNFPWIYIIVREGGDIDL